MSPYASELANARLDALRALVDALNEAETPDEKRRCAVAIFNAPDPCDLDDEIELEDQEDGSEKEDDAHDKVGEDDVNKQDDNSDDQETDDADPAPARTSTPMPPAVPALSNRRCDLATPAPPDPQLPVA